MTKNIPHSSCLLLETSHSARNQSMMARHTLLALLALWGSTMMNWACNVPVFRYALERWERDLYQIVILKNGAFTDEEVARAQAFQDGTMARDGFLNAKVSLADVSEAAMRETVVGMYPDALEMAGEGLGTLALFYPSESRKREILWQAPFTDGAVAEVQAAAAYPPLMDALLAGASTVFVLVESGDATADDAAFEQLQKSASDLVDTLEIPEGIITTEGEVTGGRLTAEEARAEDPANQLKSGIPLRIAFDTLRLKRDIEGQTVLRSLLLNLEEGLLDEQDQPMVFPVFGRGRVLPPMVGEAIHHENIEAAAQYLCGACSCQMKAQNPGMDSLTAVDWQAYLDGSEVIQAREVPALSGFLPGDKKIEMVPTSVPAVEALDNGRAGSAVWRSAGILGAVAMAALLLGSWLIVSRRSQNE